MWPTKPPAIARLIVVFTDTPRTPADWRSEKAPYQRLKHQTWWLQGFLISHGLSQTFACSGSCINNCLYFSSGTTSCNSTNSKTRHWQNHDGNGDFKTGINTCLLARINLIQRPNSKPFYTISYIWTQFSSSALDFAKMFLVYFIFYWRQKIPIREKLDISINSWNLKLKHFDEKHRHVLHERYDLG